MVIKFDNYDLGYLVVSVAKDKNTADAYLEKGLACLFIDNNQINVLPFNKKLVCRNQEDRLALLRNHDAIEIGEDGMGYLYYSDASQDNGIVITGQCNSNCVMCPSSDLSRKKAGLHSLNDLIMLASHIPPSVGHLTITGGEPFLIRNDIFTFFSYLKQRYPFTEFLLLTNGRAFSIEKYCMSLADTIPRKTVIGIPIHGYDEATHDSVTRSPGSFRQTAAGIKQLAKYGVFVEIRMVVSKITACYITEIAKLVLSEFNNVSSVKIMGLEMLGNAAINQNDIWIPYREAFEASKEAVNLLISSGIDVSLYNFPLCAVDAEYWQICAQSITDNKVRFAPKCSQCHYQDACGGLFSGSYRLASPDVQPL